MKYNIVSHPTLYEGVMFRSRLEARWAALFDLIKWTWEYEPFDIFGWTPDFKVTFPCGHSECSGKHTLLVEVKPYESIEEFKGHECMNYPYGGFDKRIPADASAAFGNSPDVTYWEMVHGSGGGEENIFNWAGLATHNAYRFVWDMWKRAGYITRYNPRQNNELR